jgi:pimeloyl-ACP methyl ester carboxylesterase
VGFCRFQLLYAGLFITSLLSAQYLGERVDIGGRHLYIACSGEAKESTPAVILISGRGSDSKAWALAQPLMARGVKVCSYDRAGLGKSDKGPVNPTGQNVVSDLHLLLSATNLHSPFVLVGHSVGGLIARLYASNFPNEVSGMVLVDSYSENERPGMRKIFAEFMGRPPTAETSAPEDLDLDAMDRQARKEHWTANIPIIVLSRDGPKSPPTSPMNLRMEVLRKELQAELATRSKFSEHLVISGAGHFIQADNPSAVVRAVRDVLEQVAKAEKPR